MNKKQIIYIVGFGMTLVGSVLTMANGVANISKFLLVNKGIVESPLNGDLDSDSDPYAMFVNENIDVKEYAGTADDYLNSKHDIDTDDEVVNDIMDEYNNQVSDTEDDTYTEITPSINTSKTFDYTNYGELEEEAYASMQFEFEDENVDVSFVSEDYCIQQVVDKKMYFLYRVDSTPMAIMQFSDSATVENDLLSQSDLDEKIFGGVFCKTSVNIDSDDTTELYAYALDDDYTIMFFVNNTLSADEIADFVSNIIVTVTPN